MEFATEQTDLELRLPILGPGFICDVSTDLFVFFFFFLNNAPWMGVCNLGEGAAEQEIGLVVESKL